MPPYVDTFPLELFGYIIAAGIVTEIVILLLTEFCRLPNPFICGAATNAADADSDDTETESQGGLN